MCPDEYHEHMWTQIRLNTCDLCSHIAVWQHPLGGLRCKTCPRTPETKP